MEHIERHLIVMDKLGTNEVSKYVKNKHIQEKLSNEILSKKFTYRSEEPLFIMLVDSLNEKKNELHNIIVHLLFYCDHEKDEEKMLKYSSQFDSEMTEYNNMILLYDDYVKLFETTQLINTLKQY
jgi:hypothetical protein